MTGSEWRPVPAGGADDPPAVPEPDWSVGPTEDDLRALDGLHGPDPRDEDDR